MGKEMKEKWNKNKRKRANFDKLALSSLKTEQFGAKTIICINSSIFLNHVPHWIRPIHMATNLAIKSSKDLYKPFKNSYISYGEGPKLVKLPRGSAFKKLEYMKKIKEHLVLT